MRKHTKVLVVEPKVTIGATRKFLFLLRITNDNDIEQPAGIPAGVFGCYALSYFCRHRHGQSPADRPAYAPALKLLLRKRPSF